VWEVWLVRSDLCIPKKPKGLGLDLFFQVFGYLGFGFGYFANLLQISNKIIKITKNFFSFWVWF